MMMAAANDGRIDGDKAMMESLTAFWREAPRAQRSGFRRP
jgi:delta-aminolevulinic acid dehydratase/porphobilinogen synthase